MLSIKLLSLDTSSGSTGWAIFINGKYNKSDVIDFKSEKDGGHRVKLMLSSIFKLIKTENPEVVLWETPVVIRNPQTQRMLTMIIGAIMGFCIENNIEYDEMRPTEWRKFCKDDMEKLPTKRDELKKWSINKVKILFDVNVGDDESDGILLGFAYIRKYGDK